jgi:hypothetical protein
MISVVEHLPGMPEGLGLIPSTKNIFLKYELDDFILVFFTKSCITFYHYRRSLSKQVIQLMTCSDPTKLLLEVYSFVFFFFTNIIEMSSLIYNAYNIL